MHNIKPLNVYNKITQQAKVESLFPEATTAFHSDINDDYILFRFKTARFLNFLFKENGKYIQISLKV